MFKTQKSRAIVAQTLYVGGILGLVLAGALTARETLAAQGITSGFAFLHKSAGWELNFSTLPVTAYSPYWMLLLTGLINTLLLGLVSLVGATVIGGFVGLARVSSNKAAQLVGLIYVEIFRNIPVLLQVVFWYALANQLPAPRQALSLGAVMLSNRGLYLPGFNVAGWAVVLFYVILALAVAGLIWLAAARRFKRLALPRKRAIAALIAAGAGGLGALVLYLGHTAGAAIVTVPVLSGLNIRGGYRIQPEFYALAFAISLYGGAYVGEIVRGGFKAVGRGQLEAAASLGLTGWQVFVTVRLPLALRSMLPILTNQYVWLMKATTLGIVVGYSDFFMTIAGAITHSGQTLELIGLLMAGFLLINFTLSTILNRINKAVALKGHQLRS